MGNAREKSWYFHGVAGCALGKPFQLPLHGMSSLSYSMSCKSVGRSKGPMSLQVHLSIPAEEGKNRQSLCLLPCRAYSVYLASLPMDRVCDAIDEACPFLIASLPNTPTPTPLFPWVKRNNGSGTTGHSCTELQTLDKWVGRQQVTICGQVISFANGFSKGKEEMCEQATFLCWAGETGKSWAWEKGNSLTLPGILRFQNGKKKLLGGNVLEPWLTWSKGSHVWTICGTSKRCAFGSDFLLHPCKCTALDRSLTHERGQV